MTSAKPFMTILIAGPPRLGVGREDSGLAAASQKKMERYALEVFRAGHIPLLSDWPAVSEMNGATPDPSEGDAFKVVAMRWLQRCDAVLRVGGDESESLDEVVRLGRELGLAIYEKLEEIPGC